MEKQKEQETKKQKCKVCKKHKKLNWEGICETCQQEGFFLSQRGKITHVDVCGYNYNYSS